jgi:Arc/MetJ-type ribon-helix-helix transcriptional regulator
MTITLSADQERLIAEAMQTGGYEKADDMIARALEILRAKDGHLHDCQGMIAATIDRALDQFERGEFFTGDESRVDLERRKAAWLRDQPR